ncbi:hypothetical protein TNCV_2662251 [Trichonephila clavipes]|nr:hypothetical protein TNCV_2662251 [Trichonephila clavipes]
MNAIDFLHHENPSTWAGVEPFSLQMCVSISHSYQNKKDNGIGRGSPVVKVKDRGWLVTSSSPVPLKTHRVGVRCTLNLLRAQTSSHWCGVIVRNSSKLVEKSFLGLEES